jgi:hypothetical protein
MRFRPDTGDPAGLLPIVKRVPTGQGGLDVTSIATGAGGVWLTIGQA